MWAKAASPSTMCVRLSHVGRHCQYFIKMETINPIAASFSIAHGATETVRNVIASHVFLRRSNLPLVSRRLPPRGLVAGVAVLHFVRNDRFLSSVSEAPPREPRSGLRAVAMRICQVEIGCLAQEEIASSLTLLAMTYLMITLKRY